LPPAEEAQPSDWTYGTPTRYTTRLKLDNVKAGSYLWGVGIVDCSKEGFPIGIQLAAKKEKTAGGWVKLHEITVQ